jgi:putative SOS response-associated peptidase YedK
LARAGTEKWGSRGNCNSDLAAQPDEVVDGVAVRTVAAKGLVRPIHDRMRAVLAPEDFAARLDARQRDPAKLLPLLRPYPAESMRRRPVDRRVNSVKVDEPGLTAAIELPVRSRQPGQFDAA